jgi:hypothetical protein
MLVVDSLVSVNKNIRHPIGYLPFNQRIHLKMLLYRMIEDADLNVSIMSDTGVVTNTNYE